MPWWAIEAVADVDHLVRAVPAQAGHAVAVDRELDARAPAEPGCRARCGRVGGVAGQRLHRDLAVDAGKAPELLGDHRGLERALGRQ